ncbi:MAG: glycosyltransferase [Pseudomonadota bacterium]
MLFCDIASFYSNTGGGVRTYHNQKLKFFETQEWHKYIMIAPSHTDKVEHLPGGTIYWIKAFRFDANYYHLYNPFKIRKIISDYKPDVVELGSPYLDYWITKLAISNKVPIKTAFYHCDFPDSYVRPFFENKIGFAEGFATKLCYKYVKYIYSKLDTTLVASKFIAEKLSNLGLENILQSSLGVDTEIYNKKKRDEEFRKELGINPEDKALLYAGRFGPEKGIKVLIDASENITNNKKTHLIYAGTGPYLEAIKEIAKKFENVHYLGYIKDPTNLAQIYASADGFISPGPQETFGLGIIEALASGLPILSADEGAGVELVKDYGCGLFFKAWDKASLSQKAIELISNDYTEGLEAAQKNLVSTYNWNTIFSKNIEYYEKLRDKKG